MSAFNSPFADNPPDGTMRSSRLARGLSLRSAARTMGVSAAYLSDIERGRRNLTPDIERRFLAAISGDQESQEDKSRAEFEAWLSAALDNETGSYSGGEYASGDIQWSWFAWRAALEWERKRRTAP